MIGRLARLFRGAARQRGRPLFVVAASWLAAGLGLLVAAPEAASGVMFFLMFFSYASSAFAPGRTMPWWLRGFARDQPATPVIETLRGLLLRQPVGAHLWIALAWCAGILVVSVPVSAFAFRRRTA
jgi:ABC-2 type transport system permease protein